MRRILIPTIVLITALSLAGCSAAPGIGNSGGSATSAVGAPRPAGGTAKDLASGASSGSASSGSASGIASKSNAIAIEREVVTTGSVAMTVKDPATAANTATQLVEAAGGRVDARSIIAATKTETARAMLDLRIPSTALTATLDALGKLGTVTSIKTSSQDVTTQGQDLDARIHALSTSIDRLLALESKSASVTELIELESAISDRQGELDSLTAQRRYLSDQVAMASIQLSLVTPAEAPVVKPTTPADAFGAGLAAFAGFFTSVLLVISYLVPWIVLVAVIGIVLLLILRRRRQGTSVEPRA